MPASPAAQGAQARAALFGVTVTGGPKTFPSGTGHLFTVAGGRVMLTSVTGVVTTVIQSQACTISIGNTPTGGSAATTSITSASASVSGVAVGASFGVPAFSSGNPAAMVFTGASGVLAAVDVGVPLDNGVCICMVPAGTIDWTVSAQNTGAITWTVAYVPYDTGATITAL